MANPSEPRNPFYFSLLAVGLIFIVTVLAYAVIPVLEEKAMNAGTRPPTSEVREWLAKDGWILVLAEVALLVILGLACMGLDRWRRLQEEATKPTTENSSTTKVETPPPG